jgi:hypothetical protein
MPKESNNGKSDSVKPPQPGNMSSGNAHWPVRVEYGLAGVERWLEPADHMDYLIRRSLLGRVNRGYPRGPHRFGHPLVQSLAGAGPAGDKQLFGEQLIVS